MSEGFRALDKLCKQNNDKDTAENNEQIMNMYFNLDKEYQATEWAIDYANYHYRKIRLFNKLLGG